MESSGLLHDCAATPLPGAGRAWVDTLRSNGARRSSGLGFPTRKVEDWKYTDLGALTGAPYGTTPRTGGVIPVPETGARRVVFVNGRWDEERSAPGELPAGVELLPLSSALEEAHEFVSRNLGRIATLERKHFVALNTAWLADGLALRVGDGVVVDEPLEIVFAGAPGDCRSAWHPRNLIVLGRGASLTLVERHCGEGDYFANLVEEIVLAPGSRLHHYRLQDDSRDAVHIATTEVEVSAGAHFESFVLSTGAAMARSQIAVELKESGASTRLDGAYLGRRRQQLDNVTLIDHAAPDCTSKEAYRGILDDNAKGVFQGRVVVRKHATGSDSHQSNKALLLSGRAEIDAKPELEIYADDVTCGHGATVGEIDPDALFYLRSRGIPLDMAEGLLVEAFVEGVVENIASSSVRDMFREHAVSWHRAA